MCGTTLNATCYNFRKPVNLAYNFSDAGRTFTWSLQIIHSFAQKLFQKISQSITIWCAVGHLFISKCVEKCIFGGKTQNCNTEDKLLMLKNEGRLSINQMGEMLFLLMTVHINESSMANILYFEEVANIAGVHIKMGISRGKIINVHIKEGKFIHFKVCVEGLFCTNLDDPSMSTNPNSVSVKYYSYIYTI